MSRQDDWFDLWGAFADDGSPLVKVSGDEIANAAIGDGPFRLLCLLRYLSISPERSITDYSVAEVARMRGDAPRAVRRSLETLRERGLLEPFASVPWIVGKPEGFVYFIQSEQGGPIKIGSTTDTRKRLRELQTGSPTRLMLIGLVEGSEDYERELHRKFFHLRLEGEWFLNGPELIDFVRCLNEGNE